MKSRAGGGERRGNRGCACAACAGSFVREPMWRVALQPPACNHPAEVADLARSLRGGLGGRRRMPFAIVDDNQEGEDDARVSNTTVKFRLKLRAALVCPILLSLQRRSGSRETAIPLVL